LPSPLQEPRACNVLLLSATVVQPSPPSLLLFSFPYSMSSPPCLNLSSLAGQDFCYFFLLFLSDLCPCNPSCFIRSGDGRGFNLALIFAFFSLSLSPVRRPLEAYIMRSRRAPVRKSLFSCSSLFLKSFLFLSVVKI